MAKTIRFIDLREQKSDTLILNTYRHTTFRQCSRST